MMGLMDEISNRMTVADMETEMFANTAGNVEAESHRVQSAHAGAGAGHRQQAG